jgi:hypothetical protein
MVGFYTLQGFQGYKICKNWPSGLFSMEFTRSEQIMEIEFELEFGN